MSDTYGLDEATIDEAAAALFLRVCEPTEANWEDDIEEEGRESWRDTVRLLLPILAPAVRRVQIDQMLADLNAGRGVLVLPDMTGVVVHLSVRDTDVNPHDLAGFVRSYLRDAEWEDTPDAMEGWPEADDEEVAS